jgi:hypothetical protein
MLFNVLEVLFVLASLVVIPVLINKSTEGERFDWIKPHLREAWTLVFVFVSSYFLSKPSIWEFTMNASKQWSPWVAYPLVAVTGALLLSGYYWLAGQMFVAPTTAVKVTPAKDEGLLTHPDLMPLVREITIPSRLLVNLGPGPLLPSQNSDSSKEGMMFYGLLENLSRVAFEPLFKGSTTPPLKETFVLPEADRPKDRKAGARFAAELFQYALFRSIDLLQHSSTEFVGGSHRTATVPPEAIVYPAEKLAAAVKTNHFSRVGQEPMLWQGGWQVRVPKGSEIVFTQHEGDSTASPTYAVEFTNPSLYLLRVSSSVGTVYNPVANDATLTAYELTIKCYFEFKRKADSDPFQQNEYEKWATTLFAGLQQTASKVGSRTLGNPDAK